MQIIGGSFVLDHDGDGASSEPATYTVNLLSNAPITTSGEIAAAAAAPPTTVQVGSRLDATFDLAFPETVVPADAPATVPYITVRVNNLNAPDQAGASTLTTSLTGLHRPLADVRTLTQNFSLADSMEGFKLGFHELFTKLDEALDTAAGTGTAARRQQLEEAADFLLQIRDSVFDNLKLIHPASDVLTPESITQALFDAFGPGGLSWPENALAPVTASSTSRHQRGLPEVTPGGRELVVGVEYQMDRRCRPTYRVPRGPRLAAAGVGSGVDTFRVRLSGFNCP